MGMKKKLVFGSAVVLVLAGLAGSYRLWTVLESSRSDVADNMVKLADFKSNDAEAIRRGEYVMLSLIHISEPTRPVCSSRMPSSA